MSGGEGGGDNQGRSRLNGMFTRPAQRHPTSAHQWRAEDFETVVTRRENLKASVSNNASCGREVLQKKRPLNLAGAGPCLRGRLGRDYFACTGF